MSDQGRKYIIKTSQTPIREGLISVVPGVDNLINDAVSLIEVELIKFRKKVNSGKSLDAAEGRLVVNYIKGLVELSRESRERAKAEDLSKLTNEELMDLAKQVLSRSPIPAIPATDVKEEEND